MPNTKMFAVFTLILLGVYREVFKRIVDLRALLVVECVLEYPSVF